MTLFFNLTSLRKASTKYKVPILKALALLISRDKPKTKAEAILLDTLLRANNRTSFLIHPERLLADSKTLELYKEQYLILSAYRDYTLYKIYGTTSLPLSFFPDLDIAKVVNNSILEITTDNNIKFKYED